MNRSVPFALFVSCVLVLAGCPMDMPADGGTDVPGRDTPGTDVPATDTPGDVAMLDVPVGDVPATDAGPADAPDAPASCMCSGGLSCVRGVCIATCGGVADLDGALAAGVTPVSHSCRSPSAFDVVGSNVYELEAVMGSSGIALRLVRWVAADGAITPTTLAERTYTPSSDPPESVFPGFVAVSADESHALFGYTTSLAGFVGGVVDVRTASMTFTEASAPGNFDAAFVVGDQYFVNGLGHGALTGQGMYLVDAEGAAAPRLAVNGMGDASGSVALWPEEDVVVFGGAYFGGTWPDGSAGGIVFFLDLERATGTPGTIDAYAMAQRFPSLPSSFELLSSGRLASLRYDDAFGIDGVIYYQLSRAAGGMVSAASAVEIAVDDTFFNLGAIENDVLLVHAGGALRVRLP